MVVTPVPLGLLRRRRLLRRYRHGAATHDTVDRCVSEAPVEAVTVDPACKAAVDTAVHALESAGHRVVDTPIPLPPASELIAAFTTIWNVGAAGIPLADPDAIEPHNRVLRDAARDIDSWAYAQAVQQTQRFSRRIVDAFVARFDLLVTPTMACLPPPVGAWRDGAAENPLMALLNCYPLAVFTSLFNVTGLPAISVPIHHDHSTGLPVGVQIVATPWGEDRLLQVARTLELAHPWADRRPAIARGPMSCCIRLANTRVALRRAHQPPRTTGSRRRPDGRLRS
jgi:amidase